MNRINKAEIPKLNLMHRRLARGRPSGHHLHQYVCIHLVSNPGQTLVHPSPGVIPRLDGALHTDGVSLFLPAAGLTSPEFRGAVYAFASQLVFNILWSAAFFGACSRPNSRIGCE